MQEAHRVLKPNGLFLLVDNVAPESDELAKWMNAIEKRRDGSHLEAYSVSTWIQWMSQAGFDLQFFRRWFRVKNFETWANRAQMSLEEKKNLESEILHLSEDMRTYFGVELEGEQLKKLRHEVGFFVGKK